MADTNDFTVKGGPSVSIKKVDGVTVNFGSKASLPDKLSDVCAASIAKISSAPGPRGPAAQTNLSSKTTAA